MTSSCKKGGDTDCNEGGGGESSRADAEREGGREGVQGNDSNSTLLDSQ